MLRGFAFTLLVAVGVSCMKMRETVERTVMVRTTGSDLQPAATGFIYKKQDDGEESVIEMGESEVMEQLSKLYTEPHAYVAPIPIKKAFENKEKSKDDERIIPVKEKAEDDHVGHVDGIADDDYKKIFDEYNSQYGDNTSYEDYLRSLGHVVDGYKEGYKGGSKQDDEGYKGYKDKNYYKNGGTGDYHNEKYESYSFSGKGSHEDSDDDADRHHYDNRKIYKGHNDANSKEKSDGYLNVFNKDEKYKDYGSYGNDDKTFHGAGYGKDGSHETGHHTGILIKHDEDDKASGEHGHNQSAEDESSQGKHGDFESEGRQTTDHGYGFKIKH